MAKKAHTLHRMHMRNVRSSYDSMAGNEEIQWILDSGASPIYSILKGVRKLEKPFYVTVPTGSTVLVEKVGSINLDRIIKLDNVLHVPDFSCNLISIH